MNQIEEIKIENLIYEIRGKQIMLDSDVANLFGYETKYLNRQVMRNINRFPENYCFQLTELEYKNLRCQNVTSSNDNNYGGRRYLPYVFTEYGITMLAGILKSDVAVKASLRIVDTFIMMRKYISNNLIEQQFINEMVITHEKDIKLLQESFSKFEEKRKVNEIYFEGQIYDAYSKIIDIFKEAKDELIIVDGYADKSVLDMIKNLKVKVKLIVKENSLISKLDIEKYNKQYNNLEIKYTNIYHDRYFIIDNTIFYHCGTSINKIGSKVFSINILEDDVIKELLLDKISKL